MAYNKKTWANGDLITKESMNNIENGIYKAHDEIETLKNNTSTGGSNNASDITITDTGNYFTSTNVEGALQEAGSQIKEIKNNGVTTETVENKVQSVIDAKIADGTIANLTIADGSVTKEKLDPSIKLGIEDGSINEVKLDVNLRKNIREKTTIENNNFYYMTFKNWDSTNDGADNWIRFYFNDDDKVVIPTGSEIELHIELELDDINAIDKISFTNGNFRGDKIEIVDKFANIIHAKYSTLLTNDLNLANELYVKIKHFYYT